MSTDRAQHRAPAPVPTGIKGRCPRCGEGRLFSGFLALNPRCQACDLDFDFADPGDGPAVFVILILGFVVAASALLLELAYAPPIWLHAVLWPPLVLMFSFGMLRPMRGVLIALQYVHQTQPGETKKDAGSDR